MSTPMKESQVEMLKGPLDGHKVLLQDTSDIFRYTTIDLVTKVKVVYFYMRISDTQFTYWRHRLFRAVT